MPKAIFTWKGPLPTDAEVGADPTTRYSADFGEQWAYQAAKPVTLAVMESLGRLPDVTAVEGPDFDESNWDFVVRIGRQGYWVSVGCEVDGKHDNLFAVEPTLLRGCLTALFARRPSESALAPARDLLQQALAGHPLIADVRWVDEA